MKKILLLIISLFLLSFPAFSQLNVQKKVERTELVGKARSGHVKLCRSASGDFYIIATTTNRFDDLMVFYIGGTVDIATKTLNDLIGVFSMKKGEHLEVTDANGRAFKLYVDAILGQPIVDFQPVDKVQAGSCGIAKNEAKKLLESLKKYEPYTKFLD